LLLDLQYHHLFSSDALFGLEFSNEGRDGSEAWYQEEVRIQSNDGSVWNALALSNSVLLQTKWQISWR